MNYARVVNTVRMLKKSVLDFFNHDLAEVNSSKSHKLLDFLSLAIWQSIHGLLSRLFFNTSLRVSRGPGLQKAVRTAISKIHY